QPIVVGKPEPPLFRMALARLGCRPQEAAMVGDSVASDVAGGRAAGMRTVLYAPDGAPPDVADVVVRSFREPARAAGLTRRSRPIRSQASVRCQLSVVSGPSACQITAGRRPNVEIVTSGFLHE